MFPVRRLTSISATAAPYETWWVPSPMPRPVTTSAADSVEAATRGFPPTPPAAGSAAGDALGGGRCRSRAPWLPPCHVGRGSEHAEPAFVADIVAAEFER